MPDRVECAARRDRGARRAGADARAARAGRARRRVVSGAELGARAGRGARRARAVRHGQPRPSPARAGRAVRRRCGRSARAGTRASRVSSGGARARARVSFGCGGTVLGADGGEPVDATFRLERNVWTGPVEPRLVLRHAAACAPPPIERARRAARLPGARRSSELERALEAPDAAGASSAAGRALRTILDRRGESPLAVLADARAAGGAGARGVRGGAAAAARPGRAGRGLLARRARMRSRGTRAARPVRAGRRARPAGRAPRGALRSVAGAASPICRGARLSYALHSRCTSWSTDSGLRSPPSTGP